MNLLPPDSHRDGKNEKNMKTTMRILLPALILGLASSCGTTGKNAEYRTDSTGLAGDNFNLPGALALFKGSNTLAEYEQKLNSDPTVNNLDLNSDGKVDYIKVLDLRDDKAHAVVLQVPVVSAGTNQLQDVAVIELQPNGDLMQLQIIGDEDIFGRALVVQPKDNTLKIVTATAAIEPKTTTVVQPLISVNGWPIISTLFSTMPNTYISPWTTASTPAYYVVREPKPFTVFLSDKKVRGFTVIETSDRIPLAYQLYVPKRQSSVFVVNRFREPLQVFRTRVVEVDDAGKTKRVKVKDGDHNNDGHPDRGNEKAEKDHKDKGHKDNDRNDDHGRGDKDHDKGDKGKK